MHAWPSACQSACIRTFTCGAVVLGTCSWAVTPYACTREEGVSCAPPRKRVSRSMEGRREMKRDGRHPSLIDEHRSHWDVPERRSNKARARINAREWSREGNTCLLCRGYAQRERSSGGHRVDTYSFPSETGQPSFFYRWWRFVRSNRDWLGRIASVSMHRSGYQRISSASLILWVKSYCTPLSYFFRAGCLRVSWWAQALMLRRWIKWITYSWLIRESSCPANDFRDSRISLKIHRSEMASACVLVQ